MVLVLLLLVPLGASQTPLNPDPTQPDPLQATPPKPDFVPGNRKVNATFETEPVEICVEVLNINGDQRTTHPAFDVTLVLDGFEEGVARIRNVISSGHSEEVCWTFHLDEGWHTFYWIVDSNNETNEVREDNNVAPVSGFRVDGPPMPDLIVYQLRVDPSEADEDARIQSFRAIVCNIGTAESEQAVVEFSDDSGEATLGRAFVGALSPARYISDCSEAAIVTYPQDRPVGTFSAEAVVDPDDEIAERNESNNARSVAYTIAPHPLPDLTVKSLTIEGAFEERASLNLNFTVENLGDKTAGPFRIAIIDNDVIVFNTSRGGLGAGSNTTVRFFISMLAGNHTIRVMVDSDGEVAEHDETNNAEQIDVLIGGEARGEEPETPQVPNLVIERIDAAPNDPRPGETVTIVAFVRNTGGKAADATLVEFTLDGQPLATGNAPALAPGRLASVQFEWPATDEGSYTIRARADAAGSVVEIDEDDNELGRTFVVVEPAPPTPPTPTTPTPTSPTPPTQQPTTPTPPTTPTTPTPTTDAGILVGEIGVNTRAVAGGVKGVVVASLRNPSLEPIGRMSVAFKVDGEPVKEILFDGLGGGATAPVSSGDIDLPAGAHEVAVEVSVLGTSIAARGTKAYDAGGGEADTPGVGVIATLLVVAIVSLVVARRRD